MKLSIVFCAMCMLHIATACQKPKENVQTESTPTKETKKVVYTCSMHPEVESDTLGKCPKCGMELVEKK